MDIFSSSILIAINTFLRRWGFTEFRQRPKLAKPVLRNDFDAIAKCGRINFGIKNLGRNLKIEQVCLIPSPDSKPIAARDFAPNDILERGHTLTASISMQLSVADYEKRKEIHVGQATLLIRAKGYPDEFRFPISKKDLAIITPAIEAYSIKAYEDFKSLGEKMKELMNSERMKQNMEQISRASMDTLVRSAIYVPRR